MEVPYSLNNPFSSSVGPAHTKIKQAQKFKLYSFVLLLFLANFIQVVDAQNFLKLGFAEGVVMKNSKLHTLVSAVSIKYLCVTLILCISLGNFLTSFSK